MKLIFYLHDSTEDNFKEVRIILKKNFEILQEWFYENHMVLNPGKSHYLIISNDSIKLDKKVLHAERQTLFFSETIFGK